MNNEVKFVGGIVGSCVSFMGASINADEISTIISIVCAVVGLLWTIVITGIIPFIKWLKKAKQDGKITAEEIDELQEIAKNVTEEVSKSDIIKKDKEK